jgi:2-polyprenyl-6-methoxyphenol hydroxylase-like FAD-dependent oxidoreductase
MVGDTLPGIKNKQFDFDIIIVGARIAGSILAVLLAQQGYRILLIDRARFPSDTLSTHFFRYPTFQAFDKLQILDRVYSIAPKLVNNFNYIDGHVFVEPVESPDGPSHYLCVRRITLDDILVGRVRGEQTVTLLEGTRVNDLLVEDGRVAGVRFSKGDRSEEASARVVIGADGIHSLVARKVEPLVERSEPVRRAMYYSYYANLEPQSGPAAEFHYRGNHLTYVFPTDKNLTLLAVSVPIEEFEEFRLRPEQRIADEFSSLPELSERFRRAERVAQVKGTGTIPGYQRLPYGPGWALVGDAGQIMDPWSGQGMDHASTHATYLADALGTWLSGKKSWDEAMQDYNRRRHEFSDKSFQRTCTYARDFRPMTDSALRRRGFR